MTRLQNMQGLLRKEEERDMRWRAADADAYLQSADYIDTAVIPLISITSSGGLKEAVEQGKAPNCFLKSLSAN